MQCCELSAVLCRDLSVLTNQMLRCQAQVRSSTHILAILLRTCVEETYAPA